MSMGRAVAQVVETLRHKSEGRGFDSRWCHWNFSLTQSFRPNYGPGVDSASNINEYQEYFLGGKGGWCLELTTLPPSCADWNLGASASWKPQGLSRSVMEFLYLYVHDMSIMYVSCCLTLRLPNLFFNFSTPCI